MTKTRNQFLISTSKWNCAISKTSLVKGCSYYDVIDFLAEEAKKFFKLSKYIKNLRARDRRLTIMITGYNFDGFLVNTLISNYQDFENFKDNIEANDDFSVYSEKSNSQFVGNQTFIQAIGQFGAITDDDVAELISMLESKKPAEAIRQKAISLIQEISDRHSSGGTVGKKINTARLERINLYSPVIGYSSDQVEKIYSCLIRLF